MKKKERLEATRFNNWNFERTVNWAKELLEKNGSIDPLVICYDREGNSYIVQCLWADEAQKDLFLRCLSIFMFTRNIVFYCMVSETWVVESEDKKIDCEPRLHPDRKDSLLVISASREERRMVGYYITKEDGKVKLTEYSKQSEKALKDGSFESLQGRLLNLLLPIELTVPQEARNIGDRVIAQYLSMAQIPMTDDLPQKDI